MGRVRVGEEMGRENNPPAQNAINARVGANLTDMV